eukprot:CAMPEP_0177287066 /NCGR_PEP_ID=MMETSP0367-20130122/73957_1 /TAXON_ID=447022 ORGANISM="Scrippsiella hangoei-like, Strain SHHI-4" /NCGR_SAMPLE_ID=MMETSP0367 /ASSEMBLY_ACC=CAM_ASM_000362 /LENGTH=83 /DNA_ID=CAMNT_0018744353 /DNA_START=250 /DNA_END=498 /DNA_ORIENTATION=+
MVSTVVANPLAALRQIRRPCVAPTSIVSTPTNSAHDRTSSCKALSCFDPIRVCVARVSDHAKQHARSCCWRDFTDSIDVVVLC